MDAMAQRLLRARLKGVPVRWRGVALPDARAAQAVQDATVAALGGVAGWKVGADHREAEPVAAPLPNANVLPTGSALTGPGWKLRGIGVHVALRLGRDLPADRVPPPRAVLQQAVDAVLPAIEVLEPRWQDWRDSPPLAQLADLLGHAALVLGAPARMAAADIDLRQLLAYLAFDGQPVASARGAHPFADPWSLLGWLAVHCSERGQPLRAGQLIATGSCTGLLFAPEGARVDGELRGIGRIALQF